MRRLTILTILLVLAVLVVAGKLYRSEGAAGRALAGKGPHVPDSAVKATKSRPTAGRKIFPYSVVPGGVYGAGEVVERVQRDPLVAAHYAPIRLGQLHRVVLEQPKLAFVSYRKRGAIYWTARPVALPAGEVVLSDGDQQIRARCGNRISDVAQLPVESKEAAPDATELNAPQEAPAVELQLANFARNANLRPALVADLGAAAPPVAGAPINLAPWQAPFLSVALAGGVPLSAIPSGGAPLLSTAAAPPETVVTGRSIPGSGPGVVRVPQGPTAVYYVPDLGKPVDRKPPAVAPPPPSTPPVDHPTPDGPETPHLPEVPKALPPTEVPQRSVPPIIDLPRCIHDCQPGGPPVTPTPEPGTWVLMLVVAGGVAGVRKWRAA